MTGITASNAVHSVEVEHVTKTFRRHHERATSLKQFITGGRRRNFDDFVALDDVSFNVRRGEVFGVIGHNGSGKSTMLKCMASIIRPTRGCVRQPRHLARNAATYRLKRAASSWPEVAEPSL